MSQKEFPLEPSTIENIDLAIYKWLDQELNLFTNTNNGFKKTPVVWVIGERAHQIKSNKGLRDTQGTFILPVITLERTGMNKDLNKKGIIWSALPEYNDEKGGALEIGTEIVQDKSSNFARTINKKKFNQYNYPRQNNKVVHKSISIPLPVYVTMTYSVEIKTQFQQQMNDLVQPFLTLTGGVNRFFIENQGHKYECFIKGDFSTENNSKNLQEEERNFTTKITIDVLGYLIGQDKNQNKPKVVVRETFVEVKIPRETVIVGDPQKFNSGLKQIYPNQIKPNLVLNFSADSINFNNSYISESVSSSISVYGIGAGTETINITSNSPEFTFFPSSFLLVGDGPSQNITVNFTPSAPGPRIGSLKIVSPEIGRAHV